MIDTYISAGVNARLKLINARIVDVENDSYFAPNVSLVIQNGKIAAMPGMPEEPEEFPADAVIDLSGMAVIPGLFNTHCHLQFIEKSEFREKQVVKNLADCLECGVTNVRDTLCFDLQENQKLIDKIAHGVIQGPRIHQAVHVGPFGDTYALRHTLKSRFLFSLLGFPVVKYDEKKSGVVVFHPNASPRDVREAVDRAVDERGAAAIKFCDQPEHFMTYKPGAAVITERQLETAVDQAIRRGVPATIHNVTAAGFRQAIKAGITSLAHLPIDNELTEDDAELLLNSKAYIEPTISVGYYMSYNLKGSGVYNHPDILRLNSFREESYSSWVEETWLPELLKYHKGQHEALSKGEMKIFGIIDISAPFRYLSKFIPTGGKNLRLLVEHGAGKRLGCGNDAGASNCSAASINQELCMMDFILNVDGVQRFSAADALRMATIQSAQAMGLEDQFGSIRTGKTADLVVIKGDPLRDCHLIGRPVQAVFMSGKLVVNRCGLQAINPEH